MNKALVIIDLQETFVSLSCKVTKRVINNVMDQIARAKKAGEYIVIVEYAGAGQTIYKIKNSLKNYPKILLVHKKNDNGSSEIIRVFTKYRITAPNTFRVVGAYSDCCVTDTIVGLKDRGFEVKEIKKACLNSKYDPR